MGLQPVKSILLRRAALLVATLGLVTAIAEIGLRAGGYSRPFFFVVDRERGWSHHPGAEGWWVEEGRGFVQIDDDGLRGSGAAVPKPDET